MKRSEYLPLVRSLDGRIFVKIFVLSVILLAGRVAYPLDIELSWCPGIGDDLSGYRVFCREEAEAFDYSKPVWEGSSTTCMIPDLDGNTIYFFVARAFDHTGKESGDSNQVRYPVLQSDPSVDDEAPEPSYETADTDGDGMPDWWEDLYGLNRCEQDSRLDVDNDLLDNLAEYENATDPTVEDTDSDGLSDGLEVAHHFDPTDPDSRPDFPLLEFGQVVINHNWLYVPFREPFLDPVVVAKPLSFFGPQPATVRIRNVGPEGFEICIQEWDYLNGRHRKEWVDYLAVEKGNYTLADGNMVEAGRFEVREMPSFEYFSFKKSFQQVPVMMAGVSSFNEPTTVVGRMKDLDTEGFAFNLQEEERSARFHAVETVSYVAWEPSSGVVNGVRFEVSTTGDVVTDAPHRIKFLHPYTSVPSFLADMQTMNEKDTANLRWKDKDLLGVEIFVHECASQDNETNHTTEEVGYMVFSNEE